MPRKCSCEASVRITTEWRPWSAIAWPNDGVLSKFG
jgi:hypothetical protein